MIVVDTDVLAAFWLNTTRTAAAEQARRKDPNWIAPVLWRAELRSVLRQYMVSDLLTYADALWIAEKAEAVMRQCTYTTKAADVLKLVERTRHSSYDCEYVALAEAEGVALVTGDRKVARLFPTVAVLLEDFVATP